MESNILDELAHSLRVPRHRRQAITRELSGHLEDSRRDLELAGWKPEEAAEVSVQRLGNPTEIAEGFVQVYRPSRRAQLGLAMALATGMLMGVWGIGGSLASATSASHHRLAHHSSIVQSAHR
jgi:hypothetical protein